VGNVPDAVFGKARASQERGGDYLVVVQRVAQHLGLREARILQVSEREPCKARKHRRARSGGTYLFVRDRLACEVEVRAVGRDVTQTFAEILAETPFLDGNRRSFLVDHGVYRQRECHNDRHAAAAQSLPHEQQSVDKP
jgi:hypothetical protein